MAPSKRDRQPLLLFTCEHGGNRVPAAYKSLFRGAGAVLATHRGLDIGALAVARSLAKTFAAPLIFATVTRLLCDLNRSPGHKRLFSEWTAPLPADARARVMARHYTPYRRQVEAWIARHLGKGRPILHLSMHSFTPELFGEVRNAEIGLLYDPRRAGEARVADRLHAALAASGTELRIRRNYPYKGVSDGFQPYLRRRFPSRDYVALEIEMNQGVVETPAGRRTMLQAMEQGLRGLL